MLLITGISGFLGYYLEQYLKKQNIEYIGIAHASKYKKEQNKYYIDLTNNNHIIQLSKDIKNCVNTIIHLAGYIDINIITNEIGDLTAGAENIYKLYNNNVLSCANIITLCQMASIKNLIFSSSQTIYGLQGMNCQYNENTKASPIEHYACSKFCCEKMLEIASKSGIDVSILRICGLWGHEKRNEFVTNFIKEAIATKTIDASYPVPLPLDVIHVDEVVKAISVILKKSNSRFNIYNISTGEPCSTEILANIIANEISETKVIRPNIPQPIITMNMKKFKRDFGFIPKSNKKYIVEAIGEMINVR